MITDKVNLNLTRKWRSRNFDQIIGQELSIRMLKNSLYLDQFFPVYLFLGQRGCGKTSTARVFASAINCVHLDKFQKNPKSNNVPCLQCPSCKAMLEGKHPDFIEIDAASHTGVDNVRQIIEACAFLPLMGKKKIYLIDEAHMLSKAAFNAFLKILEEPPLSVLFILATTNPQKIIETVRSRCFQLFFKPVSQSNLIKHLETVCKSESISYDNQGLRVIIKESQGSVRDSLNILEQVRFSFNSATKKTVQQVLGHLGQEKVIELFDILLTKKPKEVLSFLKNLKFEIFSAQYLWDKLIELFRVAIWVKNGVEPDWCIDNIDLIKKIVKAVPLDHLHDIAQMFYENEVLFTRTKSKHSLLEMILLQISQKNDFPDKSGASTTPQMVAPADEDAFDEDDQENDDCDDQEEEEIQSVDTPSKLCPKSNEGMAAAQDPSSSSGQVSQSQCSFGRIDLRASGWDTFLSLLNGLDDPLVNSIFKQGKCIEFTEGSGAVDVEFLKQFSFFKDSLVETESCWLPLLKQAFGQTAQLNTLFTGVGTIKIKKINSENKPKYDIKKNEVNSQKKSNFYRPARNKKNKEEFLAKGNLIDISDVATWKKANTLLRYFSGKVSEMQDI